MRYSEESQFHDGSIIIYSEIKIKEKKMETSQFHDGSIIMTKGCSFRGNLGFLVSIPRWFDYYEHQFDVPNARNSRSLNSTMVRLLSEKNELTVESSKGVSIPRWFDYYQRIFARHRD